MTSGWLSFRLPVRSARCTAHFCSCKASGRRPGRENFQSAPALTEAERKEEKRRERKCGKDSWSLWSARDFHPCSLWVQRGWYHLCVTLDIPRCVRDQAPCPLSARFPLLMTGSHFPPELKAVYLHYSDDSLIVWWTQKMIWSSLYILVIPDLTVGGEINLAQTCRTQTNQTKQQQADDPRWEYSNR